MTEAHKPYSLGSLIVPAVDGELMRLGYDVEALGSRALGIVVEERKDKAQVSFPELNIAVWMEHDEIADVENEAQQGEESFKSLIPDWEKADLSKLEIVFLIWKLCSLLDVKYILGTESGEMGEVWDQEDRPLDHYYKGPIDVEVTYLGLGVEEFQPELWQAAEKAVGDRLVFSRVLPSGMHKLELAVFLKR